jgi:hypothetical protein
MLEGYTQPFGSSTRVQAGGESLWFALRWRAHVEHVPVSKLLVGVDIFVCVVVNKTPEARNASSYLGPANQCDCQSSRATALLPLP